MDAAVSTPTPSGSATTGPASFSELPSAAWSDAPSASAPTSDSATTDSASAATTEPLVTTTSPDGQPQQGEPPKERWSDILANARQKAAEEALAPYAWAKQVDQQQLQQAISVASKLRVDAGPDAFIQGLQELLAEGQRNPEIAAALRSFQGKALASLRQQQQAQAADQEPQPDLPIQLEDGRVVRLYSAEQQAKREAWLEARWHSNVDQKLQPLIQTQQQLEQQREAAVRQHHDNQFVSRVFDDLKARPGVSDDSMKAMATALSQDRQFMGAQNYEQAELAVERVYRTVVLPALSQNAEARLLDSLRTKAVASSSVNPGSAAPSAPRTVTRFDQLGPDAWR